MAQPLTEHMLGEHGDIGLYEQKAESFKQNWQPRKGDTVITPRTNGALQALKADGYISWNGKLKLVDEGRTILKEWPRDELGTLSDVNNPWKTAKQWESALVGVGYSEHVARQAVAEEAPDKMLPASIVKTQLGSPEIKLDKVDNMRAAWNTWQQNEVAGS